ncbi:MAG: hypothetical protein H0W73_18340 [Bacteroidetes bacterium]|nr:hypothetical protein [Bacteroidota bacterium]
MLVLFVAVYDNAKAVCPVNATFNYTVGANGVVNFASTSTGTTSRMIIQK